MNYLKTVELTDYVTRTDIPLGQELSIIKTASRLIDAYCKRSLSIKYYKKSFEFNASLVGRIPIRPILNIFPRAYTTGLRITPFRRTPYGQREKLGRWIDVSIPADLEDFLDLSSGRIELFSSLDIDYGRLYYGGELSRIRGAYGWYATIEVKAGFLVDTKLAIGASSGANQITVVDSTGVIEGETSITIGDTTAGTVPEYLVIDVTGNVLTISPVLTGNQAIGIGVYRVVPEEIKHAIAMTIEDRLTYEPNTLRLTSTLDVITDRLSRMGIDPIPEDAQSLLNDYRN
jgi:hypothetical protein